MLHNDDEFCDIFLQSTIFDSFKERLQVASVFNYNVDVDVIVALEGALELKYEVSFEPNSAGLDQIDSVSGVPKEPIPADTVCSASQCITQRAVMRSIFEYFDIPWDESKHECLYQGINCNMENMVTNIWLSKLNMWLYIMIYNLDVCCQMVLLTRSYNCFCCMKSEQWF